MSKPLFKKGDKVVITIGRIRHEMIDDCLSIVDGLPNEVGKKATIECTHYDQHKIAKYEHFRQYCIRMADGTLKAWFDEIQLTAEI